MSAIAELSGKPLLPPHSPPRETRAGSGGASNVERLVAIAAEMLQSFGGGAFAVAAAGQIRSRTNETTAGQALARIHELTGPPYR